MEVVLRDRLEFQVLPVDMPVTEFHFFFVLRVREHAFRHFLHALDVIGMEKGENRLSQPLPRGEAAHAFRGDGLVGDFAVGIEDGDDIAQVLHEGAEAQFAFLQGFERLLAREHAAEYPRHHEKNRLLLLGPFARRVTVVETDEAPEALAREDRDAEKGEDILHIEHLPLRSGEVRHDAPNRLPHGQQLLPAGKMGVIGQGLQFRVVDLYAHRVPRPFPALTHAESAALRVRVVLENIHAVDADRFTERVQRGPDSTGGIAGRDDLSAGLRHTAQQAVALTERAQRSRGRLQGLPHVLDFITEQRVARFHLGEKTLPCFTGGKRAPEGSLELGK